MVKLEEAGDGGGGGVRGVDHSCRFVLRGSSVKVVQLLLEIGLTRLRLITKRVSGHDWE